MTNIKVSPQDIKPLHHTPSRTFILDPLWTHVCTLPLNPLWTQPDVGYPLRTLPLNPLWTHLDVGHPPRTLPLNPLWTHHDVGHPLEHTHPDTSHCVTPLGHCQHCHWTPLWTHLTAIEHPPRTLPLDPLWTTFLVISRGVQLFYGIAQS